MSVRFELRDKVGVVILDDPSRRNALSRALVEGMLSALREADGQNARALVIANAGPAFCAGADIEDLLNAGWMESAAEPTPVDVFKALVASSRVVIGAVGGAALGGGFELALCCDLVLASPGASFALPEIGHGVVPNTALARLGLLMGKRRALELVLTQRRLSAQEALALGLLNNIVPHGALIDSAIALAHDIVDNAPPGAISTAKAGFWRQHPTDWDEIGAVTDRVPEKEWREGLSAFLERRKPEYEGFWNKR